MQIKLKLINGRDYKTRVVCTITGEQMRCTECQKQENSGIEYEDSADNSIHDID